MFLSSHNPEREALCIALNPAVCAQKLGFGIVATRGTAAALQEAGVQAETVLKIQEGRPNAADLMKARRHPSWPTCRFGVGAFCRANQF